MSVRSLTPLGSPSDVTALVGTRPEGGRTPRGQPSRSQRGHAGDQFAGETGSGSCARAFLDTLAHGVFLRWPPCKAAGGRAHHQPEECATPLSTRVGTRPRPKAKRLYPRGSGGGRFAEENPAAVVALASLLATIASPARLLLHKSESSASSPIVHAVSNLIRLGRKDGVVAEYVEDDARQQPVGMN